MDSPRRKRAPKPNITKPSPTPKEVRDARLKASDSTWSAANKVYVTTRQWQKYEAGDAPMHPSSFELYLIKTGQFSLATKTTA